VTAPGPALSVPVAAPARAAARRLPLLLAGLSLVAFLMLLDGVLESADLARFDPGLHELAVSLRGPLATAAARTATALGGTTSLVLLSLVLAGLLSWRLRTLWPAACLLVALGGSTILTRALKLAVGRDRPPTQDLIGAPAHDPAFPSGHTLNSAVFLGAACLLLWPLVGPRARVALALGALLCALAVGLSRIYLGYHWTTDVLAGWAVAAAWLGLLLGAWWLSPRARAAA
jgi:undecaprenyl-diphosphatase